MHRCCRYAKSLTYVMPFEDAREALPISSAPIIAAGVQERSGGKIPNTPSATGDLASLDAMDNVPDICRPRRSSGLLHHKSDLYNGTFEPWDPWVLPVPDATRSKQPHEPSTTRDAFEWNDVSSADTETFPCLDSHTGTDRFVGHQSSLNYGDHGFNVGLKRQRHPDTNTIR